MLRQGNGETLVLFHGILGSPAVWTRVVPLLADDFEVAVPTALGHRGGPRPSRRPTTILDVIDDAERQLDEAGIERAHLAGNSMGGWISLELARRGRAASVCAISPAGLWADGVDDDGGAGSHERDRALEMLLRARREARRGRRLAPIGGASRRIRRRALADVAVHGDRLTRREFVEITEDTCGCDVAEEMIANPGHRFDTLEASCPVTIAWAERDRLFPLAAYRARAEALVPAARFEVLEGVGHIPMFDDPELVAATIRASVEAAPAPGPAGG